MKTKYNKPRAIKYEGTKALIGKRVLLIDLRSRTIDRAQRDMFPGITPDMKKNSNQVVIIDEIIESERSGNTYFTIKNDAVNYYYHLDWIEKVLD